MGELKTMGLFLVTALAEILGCYLPYLWLTQGRSVWLLLPAGASCLRSSRFPSVRQVDGALQRITPGIEQVYRR